MASQPRTFNPQKLAKQKVKRILKNISGIGLTLLAATTARADYSNTVSTLQPLAYWRLDQTTQPPPGDVATNLGTLGSAAEGVYFNDATHPVDGALVGSANTAAYFPNTTGNRVRVPFVKGLSTATTFSVEFWASPADVQSGDSDQFQTVVSFVKYGNSGWTVYQHGAAGWTFTLNGVNGTSTALNADQTVNPGSWYHVVAVYNGSQATLFVNGQQVSTTPVGSYIPVTDTTIPFTIGARADGQSGFYRYFGSVDEVAFYTNALSSQDVLLHYQNGASATPAQPYQQHVLTNHPAAYYRLDEPSYTPPDTSLLPVATNSGSLGSVVNGLYELGTKPGVDGVVYAGLGANNHAVKFDKARKSYIDVGGASELDLVSSLSVIAWIKSDLADGSFQTILGKGDDSYRLNFYGNGAAGFAAGTDNGDVIGFTSVDDGNWHQIVGVYDAAVGTNYLYVDGFLEGAQIAPNGIAGNAALPVNIGRAPDYADSRYFNGTADEVAVFNVALTPSQVQQTYYSASVPPWVAVQPSVPAVVNAGDSLTLSVQALGTPTLSYQWTLNGSAIAGKTAQTLVFGSITSADSGNYAVIVANNYGAVTSSVVTVDVKSSPVITQDEILATRYVGGSVTFSVAPVGSAPITYQWYHDGVILHGAAAASLTLKALQPSDAGHYSVLVSNASGSTNFPAAVLTVLTVASGSYTESVLSATPIAYWRLGETNGSTAYDSINGHDGDYFNVANGALGFLAGDTDKATSFGYRINSYVGNIEGIDFSDGSSFTLEAWVRGNTLQTGDVGIISKGTGGEEQFTLDAGNGGHYRLGIRTSDGTWYSIDDPGVGPDGTWQHLVAVVDNASGTLSLYVNNSLVGSAAFTPGALQSSSEPVSIGSRRSGNGAYDLNFYGTIDEVAIYNSALESSIVEAHYNLWLRPGQPPVIAQQPVATTNYTGLAASFSVDAQGDGGLTYQWLFNGTPIDGATATTLTVSPLDNTKSGNYSVTVTSPKGHVNSIPAFLAVLPAPTAIDITSNLVLHLKFDNDGDYTDYSSRGNNGTPVGTPTFVTGKVGAKALHYSSVTSHNYVSLGSPSDLSFGTNADFTVSYWIRLAAGSSTLGQVVFGNASFGLMSPGYAFGFAYGPPGQWGYSFNSQDGPNVTAAGAPGAVNDGNWHHFTFTLDRKGFATTYLDGYAVDSQLLARIGNLDRGDTLIGQTPVNSNSSEADLDDVCVWRRVLTPLEVGAIYSAGSTYGAGVASAPVQISIQPAGKDIQLVWSAGLLQSADSVTGPFTDVAGAQSPYTVTPSTEKKFYRVRE